jgi:glutaminase
MSSARPGSPIQSFLDALRAKYADFRDGEVATYIPELAKADPEQFGICLATTDGYIYEVGDSRQEFTIQSISKPFVYGLALDDHGAETILRKVGVEPSGDAFNAISLHKVTGCPLNPMINAGAIATTGQVKPDASGERIGRILEMFARYTGRPLGIDREVYASESRTGHRNRAIGHLLRNFDVLTEDPTPIVDTYFRQCAISVTCADLAILGATLANQGINPLTGERAIEESHVENVLSVMASCGMYDFSGGWIYNVGMPAKSGVAGGVLAVLPGQLGIGVYSPRLDAQGNSARALKVCEELSRAWELHQFNPPYCSQTSRRLTYTAAQRGSSRTRHRAHRSCLQEHGNRIHVVEMQGNLAFATAEPIVRDVLERVGRPLAVILDFRHVTAVNRVALRMLVDLTESLAGRGSIVFMTHTDTLDVVREQFAAHLADRGEVEQLFRYRSTDGALERCEDLLLEELRVMDESARRDLRDYEITAAFTEDEIALFDSLLKRRSHGSGETIIASGEEATNLLLVTKGVVGVWLRGTNGVRNRVASFSVGTMVGEMAFIDGARRAADVVTEGEVETAALAISDFVGLQQTHSVLHTKILRNIAVSLSMKLRKVNQDVSVLASARD